MHTYAPALLPLEEVYQPDAPRPEDVAVLLSGDSEDVDPETLRTKGGELGWGLGFSRAEEGCQ